MFTLFEIATFSIFLDHCVLEASLLFFMAVHKLYIQKSDENAFLATHIKKVILGFNYYCLILDAHVWQHQKGHKCKITFFEQK